MWDLYIVKVSHPYRLLVRTTDVHFDFCEPLDVSVFQHMRLQMACGLTGFADVYHNPFVKSAIRGHSTAQIFELVNIL